MGQVPVAGSGLMVIDAKSVDLAHLDKVQKLPMELPTQTVVTIDGDDNLDGALVRPIFEWGVGGIGHKLSSVLVQRGMTFPLKGSYFRVTFPASGLGAPVTYLCGASIAEGVCEQPIVCTPAAFGAVAAGAVSAAVALPIFARRFRITRVPAAADFIVGIGGNPGVGVADVAVGASAEMDWVPVLNTSGLSSRSVTIQAGAVDIIQANLHVELAL